jgi:hypothetical protein
MGGYSADFESARRIVLQASAEDRLEAFHDRCRELIRWTTVGGLSTSGVVDDLCQIGLEAGLAEDGIEAAIADAVVRPFEPVEAASDSSKAKSAVATVTAIDINTFLSRQFPPREKMLAPWLSTSGLAMVYAPRGTGKTLLVHGVGLAVAGAGNFLNWSADKPYRVLLLDGEMPREDLQTRIKNASYRQPPASPEHFRIAAADLCESGLPICQTQKRKCSTAMS